MRCSNIDEGIEILTGVPAGERQTGGSYPEKTINGLVDRKLRDLAEGLKQFGDREGSEEKPKKPRRRVKKTA